MNYKILTVLALILLGLVIAFGIGRCVLVPPAPTITPTSTPGVTLTYVVIKSPTPTTTPTEMSTWTPQPTITKAPTQEPTATKIVLATLPPVPSVEPTRKVWWWNCHSGTWVDYTRATWSSCVEEKDHAKR